MSWSSGRQSLGFEATAQTKHMARKVCNFSSRDDRCARKGRIAISFTSITPQQYRHLSLHCGALKGRRPKIVGLSGKVRKPIESLFESVSEHVLLQKFRRAQHRAASALKNERAQCSSPTVNRLPPRSWTARAHKRGLATTASILRAIVTSVIALTSCDRKYRSTSPAPTTPGRLSRRRCGRRRGSTARAA